MNRRELLAGVGSLAALGVGGYLVFGREGRASGDRIEPVTIDTLDVAGSPGTALSVPFEDGVTVIDLFATTCAACPAHIETLEKVRDRVGEEVQFVSVTNERLGDDQPRSYFVDWWQRHGGAWPVGFDDHGRLTKALGLPSYPFTAVVSAELMVTWSKSGQPSVDTIVAEVQDVADGA